MKTRNFFLKKLVWLVKKKLIGSPFVKRSAIAKDCLFTRIIRLFGCHHAENDPTHRRMAVNCPPATTSIGETLFQTILYQERGIISPASLLHSCGSCYKVIHPPPFRGQTHSCLHIRRIQTSQSSGREQTCT